MPQTMTQTITQTMTQTTTATINLDAIAHNLSIVRKAAPRSKVMAVIKAHAYGHGLIPVAKVLNNADCLGVARMEEAWALRRAGIKNNIVVLSAYFDKADLHSCSEMNIDIVIHNKDSLERLLSVTLPKPLNIWLKIDTGMHRLGFPSHGVNALFCLLHKSDLVADIKLMTHFACADETQNQITSEQTLQFERACESIHAPLCLANSAAILAWPDTHKDWVRPGIMLYGIDPLDKANELSKQLQPVMQMSSRLIACRKIAKGDCVGYGASWQTNRDSIIGTIAIGYADGYPRHAKNGTPVLINNVRVPLVGRVSMDMITVDLTDHPSAKVGDEAILWGPSLNINEIAAMSDTISYELLTSVGKRVNFQYLTDETAGNHLSV